MQDKVEVYRRHLSDTGHEDLVTDSWHVSVYRVGAKPSLEDLPYKLRLERGAFVEVIGGSELRALEPAIAGDHHTTVVVKDQARGRDPGRLCKVLAELAQSRGAALRPQEDGTLSLQTSEVEIQTKKPVLACGIWSRELLRPLGIDLPLVAERGYHLEFTEPEGALKNSIQDASAKIIISSMNGGVRVAGPAEFASVDAPPNYARAQALAPLAKRLLPSLKTDPARQWMGIRPSFTDNLPAVGPIPRFTNLIAAFGRCHSGLGMAPATGRIVAEHLRGKQTNRDLAMISANRF